MFKTKTVLMLVCTISGLHWIAFCMSSIYGTFGSAVTLSCNIVLNETAQEVIWDSSTKNGIVTLSSNISGILGSVPENPDLTILVVSILDVGIYTCNIRTDKTTIQSNATMLMIHGAIPDVQIESAVLSAIYGVPITLNVEIDAIPPSYHIYWTMKNNLEQIFTINSRATRYEGGNSSVPSLTISYPRLNDKGFYTCYARNALGLGYSYWIYMDVKGYVPKVSVDSLNYEVSFGSTVDLNCTVTAFPNSTKIVWQKNRNNLITTITNDTNGVTGSTNSMPVLTIKNVTIHDAGSYTCFAENSLGVGSSQSILLSVLGGRPLVEVEHILYSTVYGKPVTLNCAVYSDPVLKVVYWKKKIFGGLWSTISSGTDGVHGINLTQPSLTIEFPVKSDAGEYICFAVNAIGSSGSLSTRLVVRGEKPVVTVSANSYLANYGNEHTLYCNVTSSPVHTEVRWEVKQNGVVRTMTSKTIGIRGVTTDNPSLTISFVTLSDNGLYTCCVTNIIGTSKSRAVRLSVDAALPHVNVVLPKYTVKEGDGISLVCNVISSPRHTLVFWHKERTEVVSVLKRGTTGIIGVTIDDPSITFNPARKGDSGQYTCFAMNAVGIGFSRMVVLEVIALTEESTTEKNIIKNDKSAANYNIMYGVIGSIGTIAAVGSTIVGIWACTCRRSINDNAHHTSTSIRVNEAFTETHNDTQLHDSQTETDLDGNHLSTNDNANITLTSTRVSEACTVTDNDILLHDFQSETDLDSNHLSTNDNANSTLTSTLVSEACTVTDNDIQLHDIQSETDLDINHFERGTRPRPTELLDNNQTNYDLFRETSTKRILDNRHIYCVTGGFILAYANVREAVNQIRPNGVSSCTYDVLVYRCREIYGHIREWYDNDIDPEIGLKILNYLKRKKFIDIVIISSRVSPDGIAQKESQNEGIVLKGVKKVLKSLKKQRINNRYYGVDNL